MKWREKDCLFGFFFWEGGRLGRGEGEFCLFYPNWIFMTNFARDFPLKNVIFLEKKTSFLPRLQEWTPRKNKNKNLEKNGRKIFIKKKAIIFCEKQKGKAGEHTMK